MVKEAEQKPLKPLPNRWNRSPRFVLGFILLLVLPQAIAFTTQFARGFVPFKTVPGRVMFSWDMFAVSLDRCVLSWQPPLKIGPKEVHAFHEMAAMLEWDIAFERAQDYVDEGLKYCDRWGEVGTKAHMQCFHVNGVMSQNEFRCH